MAVPNNNPTRNTRQKTLVLQALRRTDGTHVTAEGLEEELRRQGTPVARSTVYRCLAALEERALVRRFTPPGADSCRYQYVGAGGQCRLHHHLMCGRCGQLIHFESGALAGGLEALRTQTGLFVDMEKTMLYGRCAACQSGQGEQA